MTCPKNLEIFVAFLGAKNNDMVEQVESHLAMSQKANSKSSSTKKDNKSSNTSTLASSCETLKATQPTIVHLVTSNTIMTVMMANSI